MDEVNQLLLLSLSLLLLLLLDFEKKNKRVSVKMEEKKTKKHQEGERVKTCGKGKVMDRKAMEEMGLKVGDIVFCIDPETRMRRLDETELLWTVYEAPITRITRYTGIRTEETSHNFLREDGLWSNENDEVND